MKKIMLLSFFALCIFSCIETEETHEWHASIIDGTATPVYMMKNVDTILLADYFLDVSKIDSVEKSGFYQISVANDKNSLQIRTNDSMPYAVNLRVWTGNIANDIPVFKSERKDVTIEIPDSEKHYSDLKIKGEFNSWQPTEMNYSDGIWQFETRVSPGDYQYVVIANGKEMPDPANEKIIPNGMGGTNSLLSITTNETEMAMLQTEKVTENGFTFTTTKPLSNLLVYMDNVLIPTKNIKNEGNSYSIKIPKTENGRNYIRVYGANSFGRTNDLLVPLENGNVITDASKLKRTDFHAQVMYFLMVDRFRDGNPTNTKRVDNDSILPKANYYGGDLQGIMDKINDGYFNDLGINTIWLSPITQNPEGAYGLWPAPLTKFSGYHGYWPISSSKIDYRFGDEAVFKNLIAAAHEKGLNVILDYVANHVHKEHPLYKAHPDWATDLYLPDGTMNTERWDDHRLTTWFDTFMPTLDFSKPEVVDKMTDSAAFWVTNYDLDGFRHDATKHIQLEFWRTLTQKVKKRTDRPIFQIGETYGSPELIRSYINTGMLDSQFDFNLYDASVNAFATDIPFGRLSKTLQQGLNYYGYHNKMGNISGNQDRPRFITYASGDLRFDEDAKKAGWTREVKMSDTAAYNKLAMLQAFNLAIPGIPCIYYGDEYGSIGAGDPDNRKMMQFEGLNAHEKELKNRIAELIKMRRNSMAMLYGHTEILRADEAVMILKRSYFNETVIVAFNKSNQDFTFENTTVPPNDFKIIQTK